MKAWERATMETACGFCGAQIAVGSPMLILQFTGVSVRKYRCLVCADSEVPDDLPPLATFPDVVDLASRLKMSHVSSGMPADLKKRKP